MRGRTHGQLAEDARLLRQITHAPFAGATEHGPSRHVHVAQMDPGQGVGSYVIFPDIPGRLVFRGGVFDFRQAQREQQLAAVVGDLHVFHITETAGLADGDIALRRAGRGQVAVQQVPAFVEFGNPTHVDGSLFRIGHRAAR